MKNLADVEVSSRIIGSLITVIISIIVFYIIKETVLAYIGKKKKGANRNKKKRLTLLYISVSVLKYVIFLMDIIIVLGIFNINVSASLAGLGIFGIVIGLALQDLLKDFISGIFIILDSQYNVGDYVEIDDFKGEVIGVGLKSTKVRSYNGEIKIFSNRNISTVVNYSHYNSKTVILFTFSSDEDLLKLEKIMEKLIDRLKGKLPDAVGNIQYKGVEEYGDSNLVLKLTVNVKPLKQYKTESIVLREAKLLFDEEGVKIK